MAKEEHWVRKDTAGRVSDSKGMSKRGGESYKVTKNPPPAPPKPAIKPSKTSK
jgi:hypothetical protein